MKYAVKINENFFTMFPEDNISEGFIEISEDIYNNSDMYIWQDGELVVNPNYEAEQAAKEEERINKLTMTALDFINVLKSAGFTDEQIESYLSSNLSVKHQLQFCQNVYCGVAKALMPITVGDITITADMVEIAFRLKNGEQIEEDNSTDEVSEEPPIEVEISSNPSVDNNEEIEE